MTTLETPILTPALRKAYAEALALARCKVVRERTAKGETYRGVPVGGRS